MKRVIKVVGILVALVLVAAIALPFLIDANQFRPLLQTKLSAALGREVTLGSLQLALLSGSVTASDLSISDDPAFSKSPFVRASSLKAGVELMPLILSRKLNVTGITIDQPQIELIQNPEGVWNFSSLGAKSVTPPTPDTAPSSATSPGLTVQAIKVSNGRVTFTKTVSKAPPLILDKLNFEVKDFSTDSPFTYAVTGAFSGGGEIKLDGKAGPINAGNAIATPFNANLHVTHLDLGLSGAVDPGLGINGIASIDGSVTSTGASVQLNGKLKGEQLKLAKAGTPAKSPLELDFALEHDMKKQAGTIHRGDIHLGKAVAALTGAYNIAPQIPVINIKLVGNQLDVTQLGAFLPALDIVLPLGATIEEGTADVNLAAEGPADKLIATGTIGMDTVKLANFDLASKLSILDELAGIKAAPHTEIQKFRVSLKSAPDGTQAEDIDLLVPSIGEITGAGTISAAHELAFKMRAAVKSAVGFMAGLGSKGGIPFTISGTSKSPVFKPDVKSLATDKLKDLTGGLFGGKKKP